VREGDAVEAKWSGEWWPATVVQVALVPGKDAVRALQIRFQGGGDGEADEEWVEVKSGDVRRSNTAAPLDGNYPPDEMRCTDSVTSDADFWSQTSDEDMDDIQRDLLRELLSARLPAGRILDMCAGSRSPLPRFFAEEMVGVGAARSQLLANSALDSSVELDLNADPTLPFESQEFDAVVCACGIPYLLRLGEVLQEARRVLTDEGVLALSWTAGTKAGKVVEGWSSRSEADQVELVKARLLALGFHPSSLRVDISGLTGGAKLVLVSASPSPPPKKASADKVVDSVDTASLKKTLAKVSKKRKDEKRQRDQDEKPFKVIVVSPPPARALGGVFQLPPRTHNGDKIVVEGNRYVVSKLRFIYQFKGGRYQLDEKVIEVQSQRRFETNERLNSLV